MRKRGRVRSDQRGSRQISAAESRMMDFIGFHRLHVFLTSGLASIPDYPTLQVDEAVYFCTRFSVGFSRYCASVYMYLSKPSCRWSD